MAGTVATNTCHPVFFGSSLMPSLQRLARALWQSETVDRFDCEGQPHFFECPGQFGNRDVGFPGGLKNVRILASRKRAKARLVRRA
jgi:hypothetical protein